MQDSNNQETLAGGADVTSTDGGGSESKVESVKDVLSKALGKDFPTDDAALKAVKDTFSYVGKRTEQIEAELKAKLVSDTSQYVSRAELEERDFFQAHPEMAPYKNLVKALKKDTGKSYEDVLNLDEVKNVFGKITAYDETEKSKSVLSSNPRLGQVTDKLSEAKKIAKSNPSEAGAAAAGAVIDAFGL